MKKKFLSLLLCLCVVCALLSVGAGAVDYPGFDMADYQKYLEEALKDAGMDMPDLSEVPGFNMEDWEKQVEDALKYQDLLEELDRQEEAKEAAAEAAAAQAAAEQAAQATAGPEEVTIQAPHTAQELNAKWDILKPVYTSGSPYNVAPKTTNENGDPTVGQVKYQVLEDGLNTLNFARYMAGLTGDVSLVNDFSTSAQYGSVLLAFLDGGLTHTPAKPGGLYKVSDSFYERGYEGTSESNLHLESSSKGESVGVSSSVKGYLSDLGENNRNEAGHRYYCLDPAMTGTGFGLATSRSGQLYSAMWAGSNRTLNGTGTKTTNYEAVTWPAAGYHATDFYRDGMQWSIRLNKSRYDTSKLGDIKVTVTGPGGTSVVPHVLSSTRVIIFTPTQSVRAGEKYTVEVSGLTRNDRAATLKYTVEFFDLREPGAATADRLAVDKIAVEEGVKEFSYVATNYTKPEELLQCLWAETKYVDSIQWVAAPTINVATYSKSGSFTGTLKLTLNGEFITYDVNMTIPKMTVGIGAYKAMAAAKAMTVSVSTTQAEVERHINAALPSGCTATISRFGVQAPTATEIGFVYYDMTVSETGEANPGTATIVQIIPVLGRKALDPQYLVTPAGGTASTAPAIPATGTAYPSLQLVEVDGTPMQFYMYALKDAKGNPTNYVQVRDLAYALNDTAARFSVDWNGAVNLVAGKAYSPNGGENEIPFYGEKTYTVPTKPTNVNGDPSDLVAIYLKDDDGGGYNYYQLRDLGRKLGFNVGWSGARGVFIETNKPYSGQ